jgi:myo-inositol 2-dehydrogenase/D-chiro-inositol 1-dehydrogenase
MEKYAVFGAGRIGTIHATNLAQHPHAQLAAVCDVDYACAERLATKLDCKQVIAEKIFTDQSITGVLICSATHTHADLIEQSVLAGKHVFCEKPVDLSLSRVRQCIARVTGSVSHVMVAFNRRFDPHFSHLQQRIMDNAIGAVELISIHSKDPAPPPLEYIRVSGGLFRDMAIHDLDMARHLLQEDIIAVNAQASCQVDPAIGAVGDVDTAIISLSTASGKLVQIANSRRTTYGYDQRIEVHGELGMLSTGNVVENMVTEYHTHGVTGALPMHFFLQRYASSYRTELDTFIKVVQGEEVPYPGLNDGLQALLLAEAAYLSWAEARTVNPQQLQPTGSQYATPNS